MKRSLRNITGDSPPIALIVFRYDSLIPGIQPVLHPVRHTVVQAMSSQFLWENSVGNAISKHYRKCSNCSKWRNKHLGLQMQKILIATGLSVSFQCLVKIWILFWKLTEKLPKDNEVITHRQHTFMKTKFCLTNLLSFCDMLTNGGNLSGFQQSFALF